MKSYGLITANDQKLKYDPEHQLADLQVECSNKDRTTQELERQHRKDIEIMAKLRQEILYGYDEKHHTEVKRLHSQLLEVSVWKFLNYKDNYLPFNVN